MTMADVGPGGIVRITGSSVSLTCRQPEPPGVPHTPEEAVRARAWVNSQVLKETRLKGVSWGRLLEIRKALKNPEFADSLKQDDLLKRRNRRRRRREKLRKS